VSTKIQIKQDISITSFILTDEVRVKVNIDINMSVAVLIWLSYGEVKSFHISFRKLFSII